MIATPSGGQSKCVYREEEDAACLCCDTVSKEAFIHIFVLNTEKLCTQIIIIIIILL